MKTRPTSFKTIATALLLTLLGTMAPLFAQERANDAESDSIRKTLTGQKGEQRLDTYKKLSYLSQFHDDAYNRLCIGDYLKEAQRQKNKVHEGSARMSLMAYYYNRMHTDSLISQLPIHLEFFRENEQWENYYYVWKFIIEYYAYDQMYTQALDEADKMSQEAKQRNDDYGMAYANYCLGLVYENMENYHEAMHQYERSLMHEQHDNRLTNSVYYSICQTLYHLEGDDRLYDYTQRYWAALVKSHPNMSTAELETSPQATPCLLFRAKACINRGLLKEALSLMEKAAETAKKRPVHHYHLLTTEIDYAMATGKKQQALALTDKLLQLVHDMDMEKELNTAEVKRAEVLMALGHHEEAAQLWKRIYRRTTATNTSDMQRQLTRQATLFNVSRLDMQNRMQKQRSRFIIGATILVLSIVAMLIVLILDRRWRKRMEIINQQLRDERNVVVKQNKELAIERDRAEVASHAKTAFMQSMTHEIRTPLNAISGFTQVMTTPDMELPEEARLEMSQRIQENTQLLTHILDDLIQISDLESSADLPAAEDFPVAVIVADASEAVYSRLAKNDDGSPAVAFDIQCGVPEELIVTTHPQLLLMALSKLLDNAAKFTRKGSITFSLQNASRQREDGTEERLLHFSVSDTGPGIPADKREYIFERFTKLDSFAQGTGLGLAVARMIAERMGGSLTLDPDYSGGSKFDLVIPITESNEA